MDKDIIIEQFGKLKTREDVANILGIKEKSLRYFLYKKRPENMYYSFEVPKKDGAKRKISAPEAQLKEIQRKLNEVLSAIYEPKVCAYGFLGGKSVLENASQHVNRRVVLNVDLKDFFTQIHFGRVRGMLMKAPYSIDEEAATTIAQIACLNGKLPQGAPSSPIITNMICVPLDNALMRFAKKTGCVYTRYADDITLSTFKKTFDPSVVYEDEQGVHLGQELSEILSRNSFEVNPDKVTLRYKNAHQEVTGLTVNKFPNLRRSYIRQVRAILHSSTKYGIYNAAKVYINEGYCKNPEISAKVNCADAVDEISSWFKSVIIGKVLYVKQIKGNRSLTYLSCASQVNAIFNENVFDVSELHHFDNLIRANTFILQCDDGDCYVQGSAFLIPDLGLFTSSHVTEDGGFFKIFTPQDYPHKSLGIIGKEMNEFSSDRTIDYALYNPPFPTNKDLAFQIGDSQKLKIGDQVTVVGYPKHKEGNSPYIQTCSITSEKDYMGAQFFTVSGRIVHGASGGVVLNLKYEVVGIIKGGIDTLLDDDKNENQGFVPIHLVMEHIRNKADF